MSPCQACGRLPFSFRWTRVGFLLVYARLMEADPVLLPALLPLSERHDLVGLRFQHDGDVFSDPNYREGGGQSRERERERKQRIRKRPFLSAAGDFDTFLLINTCTTAAQCEICEGM